MHCANEVSTVALNTAKMKFNKVTMLPVKEDIALMHKFLSTLCSDSLSVLQVGAENDNTQSKLWLSLTQVVLAQLILFNWRRVGELSQMTLCNFHSTNKTTNSDMLQHLSCLQHQLCSSLCQWTHRCWPCFSSTPQAASPTTTV